MTLYEHVDEFFVLQNLIDEAIVDEDGNLRELTHETRQILSDFADEVKSSFEKKAERICQFRKELDIRSNALRDEAARLTARARRDEGRISALNFVLQTAIERIGVKKLTAGNFDVSVQNNPPALDIFDIDEIPFSLFVEIPATREPDKAEIKKLLKDGKAVPGARLTVGTSLRVR